MELNPLKSVWATEFKIIASASVYNIGRYIGTYFVKTV